MVEKNVAVGDIIDTTTDLFKVANVDSLTVWANAYEENLPALLDLPPEKLRWTVRVNADPSLPPLAGRIDKIGYVSDPAQHTVMVMGRVDNPGGRLRAGQFITATVELPPAAHEVVVPASALVEDGRDSIVFVQPDPVGTLLLAAARGRGLAEPERGPPPLRCSSRRRPPGGCRRSSPASGLSPERPSSCSRPWTI